MIVKPEAPTHEDIERAGTARPHLLTVFDSSPDGRSALFHACGLASAAGGRVTVASLAVLEDTHAGCGSCRQGALLWNRQMRRMAKESLAEAAALVSAHDLCADVELFPAGRDRAKAIAEAAERCGANVIVLPSEQPRRIWVGGRPVGERLRRRGRWEIVMAPPGGSAER